MRRKGVIFFVCNMIMALIAFAAVIYTAITGELLELTLVLICFAFTTFLVTFSALFRFLYWAQFQDDILHLYWWKFCYKKIPYERMKGLSLQVAWVRGVYFGEILEEKKAVATISFYSSKETMHQQAEKQGKFYLYEHTGIPGFLGWCYFSPESIQALLNQTEETVPVYIAEQIYALYYSELRDTLSQFGHRIYIVSHTKNDCKSVLYADYTNE